ncbi:MAG TPA: response regulator [Kofleriaceae bacterium]|nr:response regulator [Kofleriaceae bacterium]
MRSSGDPLGKLLQRSGALSEEALADVLDWQRQPLPFASVCYVLGHVDEETLVRALARQHGVPGVVLDATVIALAAVDDLPWEMAFHHRLLPIYEDDHRVFVAVENPAACAQALRQLELIKGRTAVPHIALRVTLARTMRAALAARARGETTLAGRYADPDRTDHRGIMVAVSDVDDVSHSPPVQRAHEAVAIEVTKEIFDDELILMDTEEARPSDPDLLAARDGTGSDVSITERFADIGLSEPSTLSGVQLEVTAPAALIDLDGTGAAPYRAGTGGPPRVLVVDDDFATRHLLVKVLSPLGWDVSTASTGGEAIRAICAEPPDAVVSDLMLPEVGGFQICRSVKGSRKYGGIAVVLMSAVIDSGRITPELLAGYGADAYFEKPLDTERVKRTLEELCGERRAPIEAPIANDGFDHAMALYREGRTSEAMDALRAGLAIDPLSAKHHFVLANLLQKRSQVYEAIDEYEATVDLRPDYFPALTRLAYLYYKKGFSAKAIDTWRRSLPYCPDPDLRENIEVFMRKLIADMQSEP